MSCPFSGKGKGTNHGTVHVESLKSEVRNALVTPKSFAGPIALRVAWHASGTYDKNDGTGGSNGGTMRFPEEASHGANKGLSIVRDMLHEVHKAHPEISEADLWTFAGCVATEFMGGPQVPFRFGRWDDDDSRNCPPDGRIPDGALGADHIRDTFGRMGFNDQEMVALIGAHTVGRCHLVRSGWDGPWTNTPLEFNNEYFVNLIEKDWRVKEWDGPEQWEDVETGTLMMLPTDMALKTDPHFRPWAELYARDEEAFFRDFAAAYAKLMSLGCPEGCDPFGPAARASTTEEGERAARFRELAMHGSVGPMEELAPKADIFELEPSSSRSALHKAAFWGHVEAVGYLVNVDKAGRTLNIQDYNGDTALHDAARFGHLRVCQILREAGADLSIRNNEGQTAAEVAVEYGKDDVAAYLARGSGRTSRL